MKLMPERGFSILEVIASVVILSVGILAAVRMQISAIGASRAPVTNQEIATVARRALEEATAGTQQINGYQVVVTVDNCRFAGTNLTCGGGGGDVHVQRLTATVTSEIDNINFVASTFRVVN